MLLHCLSVGKHVFFQGSRDHIHYFDEHGVYALKELGAADIAVCEALENSWVLIDVDSPSWEPEAGGWLSCAPVVVMASPPDSACQNRFIKQFDGHVWIMKTWSYEELLMEACIIFAFLCCRKHRLIEIFQWFAWCICRYGR